MIDGFQSAIWNLSDIDRSTVCRYLSSCIRDTLKEFLTVLREDLRITFFGHNSPNIFNRIEVWVFNGQSIKILLRNLIEG